MTSTVRRLVRAASLAAALMATTPSLAAACAGADAPPVAGATRPAAAAVVCLLNQERAAAGLESLARNPSLRTAARRHAGDMVSRGYFAHDTPEGRTPQARAASYTPAAGQWFVGENLAWGAAGHATPRQIVRGWMASPAHRANVLRPVFRDIGVGIVAGAPRRSGAGAFTYAAGFGRR